MVNPRYEKVGTLIDKLAEECAEVIHVCMKINRFGLESYHPETLESNASMLSREMDDVERLFFQARQLISLTSPPVPVETAGSPASPGEASPQSQETGQ